MPSKLFSTISLRDLTLANRLVVSPMGQYNSRDGSATDWHLMHLGQFSLGGFGLVMTEVSAVEPAGRISHACAGIWSDENELALKRVVDFCKEYGVSALGLQIGHSGRKGSTTSMFDGAKPLMPADGGWQTVAPSEIPFAPGWQTPRALSKSELATLVEQFSAAVRRADRIGYDLVELHGGHGYLIHQFLSPLSNQRMDAWGGSLENRARLLLEIVKAVRAAVSPGFAVAVKLNSADFQRGGFSADGAREVVEMLNPLGVDLVELSGGSYEAPAMQGEARDGRTRAREADFVEFARDIRTVARMPVMVTGGVRRLPVAEQVVSSGVDMVGMGTALAIDPNLPRDWRAGKDSAPALRPIAWKNKPLASLANMATVKFQLRKLGRGKATNPRVSPLRALIVQQVSNACRVRQYQRWIAPRVDAWSPPVPRQRNAP